MAMKTPPRAMALAMLAATIGPTRASMDPANPEEWPAYIIEKHYQIIVLLGTVVVLFFICAYRRRVIFALTGDDRLHINFQSCIYGCCCEGCGLFGCNWTRSLTDSSCCPRRCRRVNICQEAAKWLGIFPYKIMFSSVVVGDIPDRGPGDYYLFVECQENPPIVTSVEEEANPATVHFNESLLINVRDTAFSSRLHLVVKRLHFLGSENLCEIYFDTETLIDWCHQVEEGGERAKRFKMRSLRMMDAEELTPPWMYCEISFPQEVVQAALEPARQDYIRVLSTTVAAAEAEPLTGSSRPAGSLVRDELKTKATVRGEFKTKATALREMTLSDFRNDNPVQAPTGFPVSELNDEDAEIKYLERGLKVLRTGMCLFVCAAFLGDCIFWSYYFYLQSCWKKWTWITMAKLKNATFPVSTPHLLLISEQCWQKTEGLGLQAGESECLPSQQQVLDTCTSPPAHAGTVRAFHAALYEWTQLDVPGIVCEASVCDRWVFLHRWMAVFVFVSLLLLVLLCSCRCALMHYIRSIVHGARLKMTKAKAEKKRKEIKDRLGA